MRKLWILIQKWYIHGSKIQGVQLGGTLSCPFTPKRDVPQFCAEVLISAHPFLVCFWVQVDLHSLILGSTLVMNACMQNLHMHTFRTWYIGNDPSVREKEYRSTVYCSIQRWPVASHRLSVRVQRKNRETCYFRQKFLQPISDNHN